MIDRRATRRRFLARTTAAGLAASAGFAGAFTPRRVRAAAAPPGPAARPEGLSAVASDLRPLVRLLEESPRESIVEEMARRIRGGLAYPHVLAALTLAAVRNVQPRPHVGFKFHAVLGLYSCHLAATSSGGDDRWLPLLWAIDYFKRSQEEEERTSGWTQRPVDEEKTPSARDAAAAFVRAMDRWDEVAADAAAAAVARRLGAHRAFELFARYAARDWRSIGHKAIFVAHAFRTLDMAGWRHAEPLLRSLAFALLAKEGSDPLGGDAPADRAWHVNLERAREIPEGWLDGRATAEAARDLLVALREASDVEASARVVKLIASGVSVASVWDGLFLAAAETFARNPGIVALHAVTSMNAIHHCFQTVADAETRKLLLLQAAAFLPLFRGAAGGGMDLRLDRLEPAPLEGGGAQAVDEIEADLARDPGRAARKLLGYLQGGGDPEAWISRVRRAVVHKVREIHDLKFASATLEDFRHVSPEWRDRYLAAAVTRVPSGDVGENAVVARARRVLGD